MATGDMFLLTMNYVTSYGASQLANVFAFEQIDGGAGAAELGIEFFENWFPTIRAFSTTALTYESLEIINLNDPTDFALQTLSGEHGDNNVEPLPPFVSLTFSYLRADRTVRNGRKAFCDVPEAYSAGGILVGDGITKAAAIRDLLDDDIDWPDDGSTWRPRIYRRPGTYASGVVSAPGLMYPIAAISEPSISSQNTRKIGRGS